MAKITMWVIPGKVAVTTAADASKTQSIMSVLKGTSHTPDTPCINCPPLFIYLFFLILPIALRFEKNQVCPGTLANSANYAKH